MVTTGSWSHSQDYLDQPMFLAKTGKGAPRRCWLWLAFPFSRHQKSGFVGETISTMPLWEMSPSGPRVPRRPAVCRLMGALPPAESVAGVAGVLGGSGVLFTFIFKPVQLA